MIYVTWYKEEKKEVNGESFFLTDFIHYAPFDEKIGLHKDINELEKKGILVGEIPQAKIKENKYSALYVNPKTKQFLYEYIDIPKTKEEILQENMREQGKQMFELTMTLIEKGVL